MTQRDFEPVKEESKQQPEIEFMMPRRADPRSAGYDIYSPVDIIIRAGTKRTIWTDIKARMMPDEILEVNTRSGNGAKFDIVIANTIGWVDSSYYENPKNDGNIGIVLANNGRLPFEIKIGDRIAQAKFSKYLTTDTDNPINNERIGGFGSSNIK